MSTYTPIATQTLSSTATSITFTGIPQNYTDLVLIANFATSSSDYVQIVLNSDTTVSNYSGTYVLGSGTAGASGRYTGANGAYWLGGSTQTATTVGNGMARYMFQNYSNSTTYKTVLQRADSAGSSAGSMVGLWRNTAAITSITFQIVNGQTINSGSTFSIYGIQAGGGYALGGDTVTTDGTYWYHTFTSSGVFIPTKNLTADYLVVAGGGGGGANYTGVAGTKGGGGAGGLRSTVTATGGGGSLESALSLTANTGYTVTIGAGGAAASTSSSARTNAGANGNNSIFSTITSIGGGGGGGGGFGATSGGSGGGAGYGSGATSTGTGTANQGYAGGAVNVGANSGGGGGGAGAVGNAGRNTGDGGGGAGVAVSISGSSVTYAGGGGAGVGDFAAGAGGSGGGGAGGVAGTANTGGGGGGAAAGGSGIVIVRYAV